MSRTVMRWGIAGSTALVVGAWAATVTSSARPLPRAAPLVVDVAFVERADTVRRNETLSHLFARHNITGQELIDALGAADGLNPRRVRARQVFTFRYRVGHDRPDRFTVRLGDGEILTVSRDSADVWSGLVEEVSWIVQLGRVHGVIQSSLTETVEAVISDSVLPPAQRARLVNDLADAVFGWTVDFARDFYPGDEFTVLYERLTSGLGDVRFGRVVAARLETRNVEQTAYVVTDELGRNAYYDAGGLSLRRTFLLSPVEFSRLSSRFAQSRFHPILKRFRPHLGVDFAAMQDAPIRVTSDGTVTRARWWGTYGTMVSVRHAKGLETRYGHMSRIEAGIVPGTRVNQGQIIGRVGQSGLATAPHVHYELLRNGQHRNPRVVSASDGKPISEALRAEFGVVVAKYNRLLQVGVPGAIAAGVD